MINYTKTEISNAVKEFNGEFLFEIFSDKTVEIINTLLEQALNPQPIYCLYDSISWDNDYFLNNFSSLKELYDSEEFKKFRNKTNHSSSFL